MNSQEIIEKTLALNLFEPSKKRANFFIVGSEYRWNNSQECLFTADVPFHFLQYVCLSLSLSEHTSELFEYRRKVKLENVHLIEEYNKNKIGIPSFCVLNCRQENVVGAFCNYWMTQKVVKNTAVCSYWRTTFEDNTDYLGIQCSMFNKKFQTFEDLKTKTEFVKNYKTRDNIRLLMEFSKLWLVKR
jgi:hypothetical protein